MERPISAMGIRMNLRFNGFPFRQLTESPSILHHRNSFIPAGYHHAHKALSALLLCPRQTRRPCLRRLRRTISQPIQAHFSFWEVRSRENGRQRFPDRRPRGGTSQPRRLPPRTSRVLTSRLAKGRRDGTPSASPPPPRASSCADVRNDAASERRGPPAPNATTCVSRDGGTSTGAFPAT